MRYTARGANRHAEFKTKNGRLSFALGLLMAGWFRPGQLEAMLRRDGVPVAQLDRRATASIGKAVTVAMVVWLVIGLLCGGGPTIAIGCALAYALTWSFVGLGVRLRQPAWGLVLALSTGLLSGLPFVLAIALSSGATRDLVVASTGGFALGAGLRRLLMPKHTRGAAIWLGIAISCLVSAAWAFHESRLLSGGVFFWPLGWRFFLVWGAACLAGAIGLTLLLPEALACLWVRWLPPTSQHRMGERLARLAIVWDETLLLSLSNCARLLRRALAARPDETLPVLYDIATKSAHPGIAIDMLGDLLAEGQRELNGARSPQRILHRLSALVHDDVRALGERVEGESSSMGFWLREERRKRQALFRALAWRSSGPTRVLATLYHQLHAAYGHQGAPIAQRLAALSHATSQDGAVLFQDGAASSPVEDMDAMVASWHLARRLLSLSHPDDLTALGTASDGEGLPDGVPMRRESAPAGVDDVFGALQEGIDAWVRYAEMPASVYRTRHLRRAMTQCNVAHRRAAFLAALADRVIFESAASHLLQLMVDAARHEGLMPRLDLSLLTPEIEVGALPAWTELVCELGNSGALDVLDVRSAVEAEGDAIEATSVTWPRIDAGRASALWMPVFVRDAGTHAVRFRVSYSSTAGGFQEQTYDRRVSFANRDVFAREGAMSAQAVTPGVAYQRSAFCGRDADIAWVAERIAGAHLVVFGPPLIGKTWLLRQLERELDAPERTAIYWAAQPAPPGERGYQLWIMALAIANVLGPGAPEAGEREDWATDWDYTLADYLLAADRAMSDGHIVILVDHIAHWFDARDVESADRLVSLFFTGELTHIRFVLAGDLDLVGRVGRVTGADATMYARRLGALSLSETRSVLHQQSQQGRDYGSVTVDAIHRATGGHPFLVQRVAARLRHRDFASSHTVVTKGAVRAVLDACTRDSKGGPLYIWRALNSAEQRVLTTLAQMELEGDEAIVVDDLRSALAQAKYYVSTSELASLLDHLYREGLLTRDESHGRFLYRHAFPLLSWWCRGVMSQD